MELENYNELFPVLAQIGFLATETGYYDQAKKIFNGVAAAIPENVNPLIGLAMVELDSGNVETSIELLDGLIKRNTEEKHLCKCFLGMALKVSGREEKSQTILTEVLESSNDSIATQLASDLLYDS